MSVFPSMLHMYRVQTDTALFTPEYSTAYRSSASDFERIHFPAISFRAHGSVLDIFFSFFLMNASISTSENFVGIDFQFPNTGSQRTFFFQPPRDPRTALMDA